MTTPERRAPDWAVLSLVCLAQFMVVLDVSIVNVALPAIRGELHLSTTGLQWVVNTYAIAFAGFLLLGGRVADLFGHKRVFLSGLVLFTAASLAGGFAQNGGMLLSARAAQGLGGAVLAPATLTILTTTFPEGPRRARALGVWSALAGAGGAAGALLGGVLTDYVSWRWILFVNVPIGAVAMAAALVVLHEHREPGRARSLDLPGAVLVTGGLMTLVYAIVGTDTHPWGSVRTLGTLAVAGVLLGWFLVHEARFAAAPLLPLRIFRRRSVAVANATMFLVGAAVFTSWFLLSLYMQNVLGYSPLKTGVAFLPQTVAIVVGAQVSSRLVATVGVRPLLVTGPLVSAAGLLWLSRITADGTYLGTLLGPSVLVTLGVGLTFTPIALAATSGVPSAQAGLASGLVSTMRQVGGAVGLAALATVAVDRTHAALAAAGLPAGSGGLARAGTHPPLLVARALTDGYGRAFLVGGVIAVAAALTALATPRPRPAVTAEPEGGGARGESVGARTAPTLALPEPE